MFSFFNSAPVIFINVSIILLLNSRPKEFSLMELGLNSSFRARLVNSSHCSALFMLLAYVIDDLDSTRKRSFDAYQRCSTDGDIKTGESLCPIYLSKSNEHFLAFVHL